jgi:hypothetical protein
MVTQITLHDATTLERSFALLSMTEEGTCGYVQIGLLRQFKNHP